MFYEVFTLLCKNHGIKPTAALQKLNISTSKLTAWKKGSLPSANVLILLSEFFCVSIDYLLKGYEFRTSNKNEQEHMKKYRTLDEFGKAAVDGLLDIESKRCETTKSKPTFIFRRLSENRVSAGAGFDLNAPDQWKSITVVDTPEARLADFAVEVEGDSMEPDYHNGEIVYISLASEVPIGQVGLFLQNGKGYIKEAGDGCIISRNPDYDDIFPKDGDIECKGRVIGIAEVI